MIGRYIISIIDSVGNFLKETKLIVTVVLHIMVGIKANMVITAIATIQMEFIHLLDHKLQ